MNQPSACALRTLRYDGNLWIGFSVDGLYLARLLCLNSLCIQFDMPIISFSCHSTTPCEAVRRIDVDVTISAGVLTLQYALEGDIDRLRIPCVSAPRRADELWRRTCFEAFVAAGYVEFNFSPSGEWATYRFQGYREGMTIIDTKAPNVSTQREKQRLILEAVVDVKTLHGFANTAEMRLALSAVIEESNGHLSYWALAHPSSQPDFHHADSFTLTLDQLGTLA
jgi:hypothetical protein